MKTTVILLLSALLLSACAHNAKTVIASTDVYPDPACPNGYTWTVEPDDAEHGACLRVGMTLTENCQSYRDTELTPTYAFWACGNTTTMTLAPNPWL
jgi:hypothetical protein